MNARGDFAMFMKKIGMILLAFMLILCNGASASALTVYSIGIPPVDWEYNS